MLADKAAGQAHAVRRGTVFVDSLAPGNEVLEKIAATGRQGDGEGSRSSLPEPVGNGNGSRVDGKQLQKLTSEFGDMGHQLKNLEKRLADQALNR